MASIKIFFKYHGVYEWLIVRFSAILTLGYILYLLFFIVFSNATPSYDDWYDFFNTNTNKIISIITLIAILTHAGIGVHHILEDYIKLSVLKLLGIWTINSILFIYLLYGIIIIWSI
ncbi:succinate dehydrogenase, hydrophobic membrane anchor protein [Candidatus Blochmannia ocreatus (nom. nud.)]|uniref:Succinate dehydrogenase hydrophobic membrane anchor subunit n=1 Tax=Candidatus Blochmannia ocreatus (nom. nud.) TaxID=251538 RepID=A0ABY4SV73_9ENTR|nr:succinate dehydrogenase, hydrophobic membrane anchor protein [Candidatus Blochmannia ocreatus]URJ25388.1 succinate dehydrogenase, hydrophobic membrane anchor protein [Candidatus Blochmannia ocreatus]